MRGSEAGLTRQQQASCYKQAPKRPLEGRQARQQLMSLLSPLCLVPAVSSISSIIYLSPIPNFPIYPNRHAGGLRQGQGQDCLPASHFAPPSRAKVTYLATQTLGVWL